MANLKELRSEMMAAAAVVKAHEATLAALSDLSGLYSGLVREAKSVIDSAATMHPANYPNLPQTAKKFAAELAASSVALPTFTRIVAEIDKAQIPEAKALKEAKARLSKLEESFRELGRPAMEAAAAELAAQAEAAEAVAARARTESSFAMQKLIMRGRLSEALKEDLIEQHE